MIIHRAPPRLPPPRADTIAVVRLNGTPMIHPIPSGTRDVLPDETREVRAITDALRGVFERHAYGEVYTPALEYESVLARAGLLDAGPAYRVFDDTGASLVLRSDMTVPIARVVATRYPTVEPPLRFCYLAHCYRGVRAQRGHPRELLQAGIELIGAPAPQGTAEALAVLCAALDAVGLEDYRIGLGDTSLFPSLMASLGVPERARPRLLEALAHRDFVALERDLAGIEIPGEARKLLLEVPQRRGGPEVLEASTPETTGAAGTNVAAADAAANMRGVHELLAPSVAERVIFDLGLVRSIGYYTGAVFEVYDPALGAPIGGGGRYDELLGRFGRSLPAVGFALGVERLHIALAGEERGEPGQAHAGALSP
jgi:ATP phosphoribosyltransferase regulatory subunit